MRHASHHRDSHHGLPLTRLKKGARGTVLSLSEASAQDRNKLMALGVMPGATLELIQRFPSFVITVGYTQIALDRETAEQIHVRLEPHDR